MAEFVNPYNFVPLPQTVVRRRPWWHTGPGSDPTDGVLYSGVLDVEWKLLSPLLIPNGTPGEQMVLQGGRVRLPGSSVKGVVRSLHEAMFNGCLRVFDSEFLPGYRMPAQSPDDAQVKDWTLGLVTKSQDGVPAEIQLGGTVEWVKASALADVLGSPPRTGDLLEIDGITEHNVQKAPGHHRDQIVPTRARTLTAQSRVVRELAAGDATLSGRVVLITDPSIRRDKGGKVIPAWWASSELTLERIELDPLDPTDAEVLTRFRQASDGTDDRRKLSNSRDPWRSATQFEQVRQGNVSLGWRAKQSGLLFPGDVVWVKVRDDGERVRCDEILLAQIWRRAGQYRTGQRVPSELLPCQEHENLCLSCATFGSVDATGSDGGTGGNSGYASHVRFSSITSAGPVEIEAITRAAMSSPRPGSGMFYINRPTPTDDPALEGDVASHWGSDGDISSSLRGRKFFWHSDPDAQFRHWRAEGAPAARPRYRAADGQPITSAAKIARQGPGAVLRGTITFDRLPWYAVEALLAAIDPRRLPAAARKGVGPTLAVHLGGGRPLGLGSATASVTGRITTVEGRYAGAGHVGLGGEMPVAAFAAVNARVGTVRAVWPRLLRLLDWDGLGPDKHLVAYPPGREWDQFGSKEFAQSYGFFQQNNGLQLARKRRAYTPLPDATNPQVIGRER